MRMRRRRRRRRRRRSRKKRRRKRRRRIELRRKKKCCALPEERLNKVTETKIRSTADARTPTKIDVTDSEMNRS